VFRGGNVRGSVAFTKDVVYLRGLLYTVAFMREALNAGRFELAQLIFAGRMTIGDVVRMQGVLRKGAVKAPLYTPRWLHTEDRLTTYLQKSRFAAAIDLGDVGLEDFAGDEE
jgi:hypothetical protein